MNFGNRFVTNKSGWLHLVRNGTSSLIQDEKKISQHQKEKTEEKVAFINGFINLKKGLRNKSCRSH
jgi:hypothetical protein